ncbi:hypothetical protein Vau01_099700 [Virgisporangium aurantiacum]|uniref:Uncharacterized protein n=1 Tax=Virgisporangium aurantiacum TaxID=175570 RepID=A0A8J4E5S8_9ACTN|nr:hypothetical protein Vau01_099700 [Virgisporangium aurantiacum]
MTGDPIVDLDYCRIGSIAGATAGSHRSRRAPTCPFATIRVSPAGVRIPGQYMGFRTEG